MIYELQLEYMCLPESWKAAKFNSIWETQIAENDGENTAVEEESLNCRDFLSMRVHLLKWRRTALCRSVW